MKVVWLALACVSAFALAAVVSKARAQGLHDDFNGSELDTTIWSADRGNGDIVVGNGVMTLSSGGELFPLVITKKNPFPEGDFVVRVGCQYVSAARCGCGLGTTTNFYSADCRPFVLWQDAVAPEGAWYVYVGTSLRTFLPLAEHLDYHIFEWDRIDGVDLCLMDGVFVASSPCSLRPIDFFFGHPRPGGCDPDAPYWTALAVDFIDISPLGPTDVHSTSWGKLKALYRAGARSAN